MEAEQRKLRRGLAPTLPYRRHGMYSTVMVIILLFPWSILGIMLVGTLGRRLRKVPAQSR